MYEFFKEIFTEVCLSLFLGLDLEDKIVATMVELTDLHFKGEPFSFDRYKFGFICGNDCKVVNSVNIYSAVRLK